jgi:nitrate/nitrite-specific signal transduction histidine kinase
MGKSSVEKNSSPRRSIGLGAKLAIIFVAVAVLPMASVSYYIITQTQGEAIGAGEALLRPETVALAGVALTGAVALIISILLARSITRPIRGLSNIATAVKNDQPVEPSDIADIKHGQDAIVQLGVAFGDMVSTLSRRLTELEMVFEIGQDITASLEVDETLQAILGRVKDLVAYEAAEITLYDRKEQALFVKAWRGRQGFEDTRGKSYRLGVGLTGKIAAERKSLLIDDAHTGEYEATPTGKTGILTLAIIVRSILGVPLIIRDRLVGTLELVSSQVGAFDENDQRLLETIAPQAALAIEKAQQVREREQKLREEIKQLRIEIDQTKRERQVSAITETNYFQELAKQAREFRRRARERRSSSEEEVSEEAA